MCANLTTNERINRRRYPWLIATPGGPAFNRYDRGMLSNLKEFWGYAASTPASSGEGGSDESGIVQRRPRDYLEVWNLHFSYTLSRVSDGKNMRTSFH